MTIGEVFTGLGFIVGLLVLYLSGRASGLATRGMGTVALAGFLGGVIGAKVSQLVFSGWPTKIPWWAIFDPKLGGKALFGGLVVGWIAVMVAKWRLGIRRSTGDHFALALPAGEAVGRIGCYFNQCCYGTKCDLPWAVEQHGALRHPAQLYTAIVAALLFVFLLWLKPRLAREGDLWRVYLFGFGITRFFLEIVRENDAVFLGLSAMQWFCIELVVFAAVGWYLSRRRVTAVNQT